MKLTPMTPLPDRIGYPTLEIAFIALANATILKGFLTGFFSSASLSKASHQFGARGSLEWLPRCSRSMMP